MLFPALSSSENNLSQCTEDEDDERYLFAKLERYGYFDLFEFHQHKVSASFAWVLTFRVAKKLQPQARHLSNLVGRSPGVLILPLFQKNRN